ncbi:MAG: 3'-5' exonuclease, partial [Candidatus Thorarchaeota archaeon]
SFDDLDGGKDSLEGYRSLMHGAIPEVHKFDSFTDEVNFIVERLTPMLAESGSMDRVCVTVRTNKLVDLYNEELRKHGIATCIIKHTEKDDSNNHGVRIATMHRVKGLEFDTVIIASANKGIIPHRRAIAGSDSVTEKEGLKAERALLYVAVTRARKNVLLTGYGDVCRWLDKNLRN